MVGTKLTKIDYGFRFFINTFQRKLKSVNDFDLSVCLSVRPHDNFRKYSLIATNLHMLTCVTPACSLMKIVYVAVILLLQGRSKEIQNITVNGRYLFKVNFSNVKISLA